MRKLLIILVLLLTPLAFAQDLYIANSANWQNIYSAGLYSALNGKDFKFLVSAKHTEILINEIPRDPIKITVIESDRVPYVKRYANRLASAGHNTDTILISEETGNLDLAKKLTQVDDYIIVNPVFGYDAISAAPLATKTNSYVLFATPDNINELTAFFDETPPANITIIGDIEETVKKELSKYNPRTIDEGNRFSNNIALAEEFREKFKSEQAILTNGEFLENDVFFAGKTNQPIIFIGKDRIPTASENYIKTSPYKVFVVLGNDLFGSAQLVKEQSGKPVLIKFAKGTTNAGGYRSVQGLDIYPTPQLELLLSLEAIFYNADKGRVDMIIRNEKTARTFATSSIIIQDQTTPIVTLGDNNAERLSGFEVRTLSYPEDLSEYTTKNLTAQLIVSYGESQDTIEKALTATVPLPIVSEQNLCDLDITRATYNEKTQRFQISVTTNKPCYTRVTLTDLTVNDTQINAQSEVTYVDGKQNVEIKQRMDSVDIADNPNLNVNARFGSEQKILIKEINKTFPFKTEMTISIPIIIGSLAITLLATLITLALWKRKSKQQH